MEQIIFANEEYSSKLLIVVRHHNILCWPFAQAEESVNVLDAAKSFLPQLELYSNVKLLETSIEVTLQSIGVT